MTIILLNDDKTIHSVFTDGAGSDPLYVAHRTLKFTDDIPLITMPFRDMDNWQKQILQAKKGGPRPQGLTGVAGNSALQERTMRGNQISGHEGEPRPRTKITIPVRVYSRPERLYGELTGRTQWVCEPTKSGPFSAVLGREYSRDAAIQDWLRRAKSESYASQYDYDLAIVT